MTQDPALPSLTHYPHPDDPSTCAVCPRRAQARSGDDWEGEPWPCYPARDEIVRSYPANPAQALLYLTGQAVEIGRVLPSEHANDIAEQVVGWYLQLIWPSRRKVLGHSG